MKIKFILIASFILAIMAIGSVNATDTLCEDVISSSDIDLELGGPNLYATDETGNFTDLVNEINDCSGNVLDIWRDYRFDNETDEQTGIVIDKDNFVINGNGYTIDGNNQTSVFIIAANNVTINNLTIINANSYRGSAFYIGLDGSLTTNYVAVENSTANFGAILAVGEYISNNDVILDSTSNIYGVVIVSNTSVTFNNAFMMSSKQLGWGFIYGLNGARITVFNSTFANTTSKYSTAIYGTNSAVNVKNSRFYNLHANNTAGAIALKDIDKCIIDNCTFINVTSEKNAGAVFADVYSQDYIEYVVINNSDFSDCYSEFGGAVMQLGGDLTIEGCNFTENSAFFDGGAVYTSFAKLLIKDSLFYNNSAQYEGSRGTYGGTLFCDRSGLNLFSSELFNSYADYGSAIYLYDSNYYIKDNIFDNNLNYEGIYNDIFSEFDGNTTILENNTYSGDDSCSLNNTEYPTIFNATGMELDLIDSTIDVTTLPSRFDLRDWGWVTPVRDQGSMGACWSFADTGAIEGAILRYLGIEMDLSENNMQDVSLQYSKYGTLGMVEGGSIVSGAYYALSWLGVFSTEYDTYDELGKISAIFAPSGAVHFQDVVLLNPRKNSTDNDILKEALLEYGALAVSYHAEQSAPYYNAGTGAQYCNEDLPHNHGVLLIGWDDDYSASNFLITPPGDGAWIFKNSWGESAGIEGYFYISYYDKTFSTKMPAVAFLLENTVQYNKNYQYDISGQLVFKNNSNEYVNIYKAVEDDYIAGVGTYFSAESIDYYVEVYVNDVLQLNQSGVSPYWGFHTIQLESFIPIEEGDIFAVKIKTSGDVPLLNSSRQFYIPGLSRYNVGGNWINASDNSEVCCIKVYTVDEIGPQQNTTLIAAYYDANDMLVATLTDDEGDVIEDASVVFNIGDMDYTVKTNSAGQARLSTKILNPGDYTADVSYKGNHQYAPSSATVDFTADKKDTNLSAVYYSDVEELTVSLVDAFTGDPLKGAIVVVVFNGEKNNVRINSKGEGTLSLAGYDHGTYSVSISYKGNANYNANTVDLKVKIKDDANISASYDGSADDLVINLVDAVTGAPLKGANVVVLINDDEYNVRINSAGEGRLSLADLDYGTYAITALYKGNANYYSVSTTLDIVVKDEVNLSAFYDGSTGDLVVTLVDAVTGAPLKGANVLVYINGEKYTVKINSKGEGRISLEGFDYGTYDVNLTYKGNAKYNPSNVNMDVVVKDEVDISAIFDDSTEELTVTLVDAVTGVPIKGAIVVVNVDGENYKVKINAAGQGVLSLANLAPGIYTVSATYKGNAKYLADYVDVEVIIAEG